jgi:flavin-binding protein dodecin
MTEWSPPFHETAAMPDPAYQLIEIVGTSTVSADDAIRNGIAQATQQLSRIDWFQVVETRGQVASGEVRQFQVIMKVGTRIGSSPDRV